MTLTEMFNLCDTCVYAPCLCGNEPENCAAYLQRNGTNGQAVWGKLICDPLSADKPEAIGPEVRRQARAVLMEELEAKGLIRYQMLNGVLYAGIRAAAPEDKT